MTASGSDLYADETRASGVEDVPQSRDRLRVFGAIIVFGLAFTLVIAVVIGVSAYGGYRAGIDERRKNTITTSIDLSSGNPIRGLDDVDATCLDCDGVGDIQSQAPESQLPTGYSGEANVTDLVSQDGDVPGVLFEDLVEVYGEQDWGPVVQHATHLRMKYPEFESDQVGGMLFVGLKNRGVQHIEEGVIELGIADLEQASEIGPLDAEARQHMNWASLYLVGMAFWELHWPTVIANLSLLHQTGPNFRDVAERLNEAYVYWGDALILDDAACDAEVEYSKALSLSKSSELISKYNDAEEACSLAQGEPTNVPDA